MLKQKSFLIVIIAFFWAGYVLLSFAQTVYGSVEFKKTADQNRNSHIDHLLSVSQTLVLLGNVDALKAHLDEAVTTTCAASSTPARAETSPCTI